MHAPHAVLQITSFAYDPIVSRKHNRETGHPCTTQEKPEEYEQTQKLRDSHLPAVAMRCAGNAGTSYLIARDVLMNVQVRTTHLATGSPARKRALKWAIENGYVRNVTRP